jgi:hypothetical protein
MSGRPVLVMNEEVMKVSSTNNVAIRAYKMSVSFFLKMEYLTRRTQDYQRNAYRFQYKYPFFFSIVTKLKTGR